jgi:hypothetical protein
VRSLQYSPAALDTLTRFHAADFVVYVEGQDDVLFWEAMFAHHGITDATFKVAGGAPELDKYADAVVGLGVNVVIARDSDFAEFAEGYGLHPRVLYTFGYSIENAMCTSTAVARTLSAVSRTNGNFVEEVERWLDQLAEALRPLVVLDLANRVGELGVSVPLDNLQRFLVKGGVNVAHAEIERVRAQIEPLFGQDQVDAFEEALRNSGKPLRQHVRGHGLLSAAAAYLRRAATGRLGRSVSLSGDAVFGLLITHCTDCLAERAESDHYSRQFSELTAA